MHGRSFACMGLDFRRRAHWHVTLVPKAKVKKVVVEVVTVELLCFL